MVTEQSQPTVQSIDEVVDFLLRDQTYLLAQEIKHRIEELNMLLVQARGRNLRVAFDTSDVPLKTGGTTQQIHVSVLKEIA